MPPQKDRSERENARLGDALFADLKEIAGAGLDLRRAEFVGPAVGEELTNQGGVGLLVALGTILIYISFRFQMKFAFGAVTALFHDVLITLGIFSVMNWEFDLTVLAALLAVIGYSLNDTIVVSDRIRENFRAVRRGATSDLIDTSLNQTLGRTLMTSTTTLLVLLALFFLGGELIRGFSLALTVGVVVGTYSSIYVASNMLVALQLSREDLLVPVKEGADQDVP
jgi:preprotein translocase subunit SecF